MPIIQTYCIYVSKDVKILGYFSKPEGAREQNNVGKATLE